jgi:ABC-2 type transport system ATP-binding protein
MMADSTAGPAIEARGLVKSYGAVKALRDVDLEVGRGELFGLIGPDGAGKTTLIRILMTLLLADAGSARVLGQDVVLNYKTLRRQLGYMPGRFSLYEDLTVEENLSLFAAIFGTSIEANYDLVRDIYSQIEPFKKRRAGKLSGGMKQKLALSCAMIHRPELILLDEPTTGVDPVSRVDFWNMLKSLKASGVTILVSTTYMDEANLCDRVALMQEGRILSIDTPSGLVAGYGRGLYAVRSANKHRLIDDIRATGPAPAPPFFSAKASILPSGANHPPWPTCGAFCKAAVIPIRTSPPSNRAWRIVLWNCLPYAKLQSHESVQHQRRPAYTEIRELYRCRRHQLRGEKRRNIRLSRCQRSG